MKHADLLIVSGAPLGATQGKQRYEQLYYEGLQANAKVAFYCPFNYPPMELPDSCEDILLGFPVPPDHPLPPHHRLIYDICDAWWDDKWHGNFKDAHEHWLQKADIITCVSSYIVTHVLERGINKPVYLLHNACGMTDEEIVQMESALKKLTSPAKAGTSYFQNALLFVGSHYSGQEWWGLREVVAVAQHFPAYLFILFLASDRRNPLEVVPQVLPENVLLYTRRRGFSYIEIAEALEEIEKEYGTVGEAVWGLIPYKPIPISFAADPIKLYDYAALGLPVISLNNGEVERLVPSGYYHLRYGEVLRNLFRVLLDIYITHATTPREYPLFYSPRRVLWFDVWRKLTQIRGDDI